MHANDTSIGYLLDMKMGSRVDESTTWLRAVDPRRLLSSARFYQIVQHALAPASSRRAFVIDYVRPESGSRILDIGCGPADDLTYMPEDVKYVGFDLSDRYIAAARNRWGDRGRFFQANVTPSLLLGYEFDIVVANGVIHHLNDEASLDLLKLARSVLTPGGRLVTKDPVFVEAQHRVARYLVSRDRGGYVRDMPAYLQLASRVFADPSIMMRDDLLRLPYNHAIMVMRNS